MPNTQPINVIIPLYINHASLYPIVEECLARLKRFYPQVIPIIVDDASPLPVMPEWDVHIANEKNMGFTYTVNKGLDNSTGDTLIIMNDDIFLEAGQLDQFLDLPDNVIASPADTASSPDDRFGAIWGMTRKTFKKLGHLDESYTHFFSDREYYDRAKKMGVEIIKWPEIVVQHIESATYKHTNKESIFTKDSQRWQDSL